MAGEARNLGWSRWAAVIGVALVIIHLAVRATSTLGWFFVAQVVYVVWWLGLLLVPITFHLTRRVVSGDRITRGLLVAASGCVLASAVVPDGLDADECLLGSCGTESWWWAMPVVAQMQLGSLALSWVAVIALLLANIRVLVVRSPGANATPCTRAHRAYNPGGSHRPGEMFDDPSSP